MRIKEPTDRVPKPLQAAVYALIRTKAPAGFAIPLWLEELIIIAYQNGRYDEAAAETFNAAFE